MLTMLKRLGIGFIYGVGFALGVAGILALGVFGGATYLTSTTGRSVSFPSPGPVESRSSPEQFVISGTSVITNRWGSISVLGTVNNKGGDTPRYVNVYADLFNKEGKFIYQCMHQFNEGLRKDQRSNFMIECHGLPKELVPSYDSYKVYARAL
jgi:hypothetical protein